jgi:2-dehydropantoate 2-reductase
MNIVVFGSGAIGSFFGGVLSKKNNVVLVGRKNHVNEINKNGLEIRGKTQLKLKIKAVEQFKEIQFSPDLILLTVKAFDTTLAVKKILPFLSKDTILLSFQNGLDNYEQIKQVIPEEQILLGVTSHGVQFMNPGIIVHQGMGSTVIGEISKKETERIKKIASLFNEAGITIEISHDILNDIWKKAIVNASINPLTSIFSCNNGYLLKNPVLEYLVEKICRESVSVAHQQGHSFSNDELIQITHKVIKDTEQNFSSMLQSIQQGKRTEIDQINGKISEIGIKNKRNASLNLLLTKIVKSL